MATTSSLPLSLDVSPLFFIRLMFLCTETDGILQLTDWYDAEKDDAVSVKNYSCKLNWIRDDLDDLILEYADLLEDIDIIAPQLDEIERTAAAQTNPYIDSTNDLLPLRTEATYFLYVAPFSDRWPAREQATCRVGEGPFGLELIFHARRLCQLVHLRAPKLVRENEARMLIAALALNRYGTEVIETI